MLQSQTKYLQNSVACHTLQSQQCSLTECQLPCINSWDQSPSSPGKASLLRKHSGGFFPLLIVSSEQTHSEVSYCLHRPGKSCFPSQQLLLPSTHLLWQFLKFSLRAQCPFCFSSTSHTAGPSVCKTLLTILA